MEKKSSKKSQQLKSELYQKVGVIAVEGGGAAIVDVDDYEFLAAFRWRRVKYHRCYYARIIDGQNPPFRQTTMHRVINHTPSDQVCHHKNRNTFDNRKINLDNMARKQHELLHKNNSLLIQFSGPAETQNQPSLPRPDPPSIKKKPEKTIESSIKNPIDSQVMTALLNGPKPPVMSHSTLPLTIISVFCRAINEFFV